MPKDYPDIDSKIDKMEPGDESVYDLIRGFGGSPQRTQIFSILCEHSEEGLLQTEIASRAECKDSTVSEAIDILEENLLVEQTSDDKIILSPVGMHIADSYIELCKYKEQIDTMKRFVKHIQNFESVDVRLLIDHWDCAEVVETDSMGLPPTHPYLDLINSSDEILELVPFLTGQGTNFEERFKSGELAGKFVLSPSVVSDLSEEYPDLYQVMIEADDVHLYSLDTEEENLPDFTLSIFEDKRVAFLEQYERTFVLFEDDEVLKWAKKTHQSYVESASEISDCS